MYTRAAPHREYIKNVLPIHIELIFCFFFKIIHFRLFLFQKHIIYTYKKTCLKSLCPLTARGGGSSALAHLGTQNISVFLVVEPLRGRGGLIKAKNGRTNLNHWSSGGVPDVSCLSTKKKYYLGVFGK